MLQDNLKLLREKKVGIDLISNQLKPFLLEVDSPNLCDKII